MVRLWMKILAAIVVVIIVGAVLFTHSVDAADSTVPGIGTLSSVMTVTFDDGTKEVLTQSTILPLNVAVFHGKNVSRIDFASTFVKDVVNLTYTSGLQAVLSYKGVVVKTTGISHTGLTPDTEKSFVDKSFFSLPGEYIGKIPGDFVFGFVVHLDTSLGKKYAVVHEIAIRIQPTVVRIEINEANIINIADVIGGFTIDALYPTVETQPIYPEHIVGNLRVGVYAV